MDDATLERAAELLRGGRLVAFPTETVYGLGADATNDRAVAGIFAAKRRPSFNPLIVHLADTGQVAALAEWNNRARRAAARFWPGPLTMVLRARADTPISKLATAGLDTIALRVPAHPLARDLLRRTGRPVAAPSANRSESLSPTRAEHVREGLGDAVACVIDGGACPVGVESTVLDLSDERPALLRPGGVARAALEALLGPLAGLAGHASPSAPRAPGQLLRHYAPRTPVRLNATHVEADEVLLGFGPDLPSGGRRQVNLSVSGDLTEAAANLFDALHRLDQVGARCIAVMSVPGTGLGEAINDRLLRSAHSPSTK
ncbi:L-threonylcarbamoyladenylate synthase [Marinivivus vitaminiproducens]|nr:L-threonylcarbamoyladenylate synthase [Geminicoccaceae bacterium SCSIO 64248]